MSKFIVAHPKLYMNVDGKMAHVSKGTELAMDDKDAKSLLSKGKILAKGSGKKVDVGSKKKGDSAS